MPHTQDVSHTRDATASVLEAAIRSFAVEAFPDLGEGYEWALVLAPRDGEPADCKVATSLESVGAYAAPLRILLAASRMLVGKQLMLLGGEISEGEWSSEDA